MKALLIEDDYDDAALLRHFLKREKSVEILATASAEEAIECLAGLLANEEAMPDVLICDLGLPGMSGQQLVKLLRTSSYLDGIPIVGYSGTQSPLSIRQFFEAGGTLFVEKSPDGWLQIARQIAQIAA